MQSARVSKGLKRAARADLLWVKYAGRASRHTIARPCKRFMVRFRFVTSEWRFGRLEHDSHPVLPGERAAQSRNMVDAQEGGCNVLLGDANEKAPPPTHPPRLRDSVCRRVRRLTDACAPTHAHLPPRLLAADATVSFDQAWRIFVERSRIDCEVHLLLKSMSRAEMAEAAFASIVTLGKLAMKSGRLRLCWTRSAGAHQSLKI